MCGVTARGKRRCYRGIVRILREWLHSSGPAACRSLPVSDGRRGHARGADAVLNLSLSLRPVKLHDTPSSGDLRQICWNARALLDIPRVLKHESVVDEAVCPPAVNWWAKVSAYRPSMIPRFASIRYSTRCTRVKRGTVSASIGGRRERG
jgi:hypothetical protein